MQKRLGMYRPRRGRWVAGVCAALAQRFDISVDLIRLIFILSFLLPGSQLLVYIVLWILIPSESH